MLIERVLLVDGVERRFLLAPPDGARPSPLVIEFHGSGHFAASQMAASALSDTFAVAAPEAAIPLRMRPEWPEGRAWNVPGVPLVTGESSETGPDDVAFARVLIDTLIAEGIADVKRIYLTGFSGGARMCSHLAGVMPERIAAIATVAGLRLPPPHSGELPPILAIHSRADEVNPYAGGAGARWDLGVEETAAAYAERYGWNGPAVENIGDTICNVYSDRTGEERLVTYALADRPHGWYGSRDSLHAAQYGTSPDDDDASALIRNFFLANAR